MRIGIFCTGSNCVPPLKYGGVQAVNHVTSEKLIELGHEVFLFAPSGSKTSGSLVTINSGWGEAVERRNVEMYLSKYIDKLDILLDTTAFGIPGNEWLNFPYINRIGGDTKKIYCKYINRNPVFPSKSHLNHHSQGDCACSKRRTNNSTVPVIYKPVSFPGKIEGIPMSDSDGGYFLCLGLVQSHKGTHLAVQLAAKSGIRLRIVGPIGDMDYFNKHIKPFLNEKITYEPAVDFDEKWELYDNAKATIFTTNCEEGGPNVPIESLLTGTPVVGFNISTLTEIVIDGQNGILCSSIESMVDRLKEIDVLRGPHCRDYVLDKFGIDTYITEYLKLMCEVVDGKRWL